MSMHLVRGLNSSNSGKKKSQPTKAQLAKWQQWHKEHNQHMKRLKLPTLTFDQFLDRLHGKTEKVAPRSQISRSKSITVSSEPNSISQHREKYPSLNSGKGSTVKKEENVYTGDRLLGIATMHKSNLVPVFSREDAKELAKMRR